MKTRQHIMTTIARRASILARMAAVATTLLAVMSPAGLQAQEPRFLAKEDIILYGIELKVDPASQTVPKDIATIVSTFLRAPNNPDTTLPAFAPDAVVKGTLSGPSFTAPIELTVTPNSPFNIPPLTKAGLHTLDNIRLVSNGDVLLRGNPESVTINVIEKLLVTQVTARPLTAAEIREKGIVFNRSNFQAYNFTAAFAIQGTTVNLEFPVLLPALQGADDINAGGVAIPTIQPPALQSLKTIIPDTLSIQRQLPNLSVVGFTLKVPQVQDQHLIAAPIPAAIVFPGNIGFLNQYFSVMLMVSNAAPAGSNLSVSELKASIVLPPGKDGHVGSDDDPLAMAQTSNGQADRVKPIGQPGPDGRIGTGDDLRTIGPGETGSAEYLVEGKREGSHVVEMRIEGTLNGLPVGPVPVNGLAAGAVLVRNPNFTLTFLHPDVVSAGEPYTLDVTVTNTSSSPANFVSLNLLSNHISGAALTGPQSQSVESIPPGDSATVSFSLVSKVTGKVTAATLDADTNVAGQFALKHSVGELGVPLSPESLVLPKEAKHLPPALRAAILGLLGKAWAVATAPPVALAPDVKRFSRQIVLDMAVSTAEAGLRIALKEPVPDSTTELAMDVVGSAYNWLPTRYPKPADLQFAQDNYVGFDDLRRRSIRGDAFAQAVADVLAPVYASSSSVSAFHEQVAEKISYRPGHISVLVGSTAGPLPFAVSIVDAGNRRLGGTDSTGKVVKQIPFSDYLIFRQGATVTGQMALVAAPATGNYTVRLEPVPGVPGSTPFTLSIVVPRADGTLRHIVFNSLTAQSAPSASFAPGDPYRLTIQLAPSGQNASPSTDATIVDPPPSVISVIQQELADILTCEQEQQTGPQVGRVVAVLFSEQVTAQSVQDRLNAQDITSFVPDGNKVVGVALQPGGRIAFLALRDPLGPFVSRNLTVSGVRDLRDNVMPVQVVAMQSTVSKAEGGQLSGRVLQADGTPVPFANVRLFYWLECGIGGGRWTGISSKSADQNGKYEWDYVLRLPARLVAINPETDEFRDVRFNLPHGGQQLKVDVVMLGRGAVSGRTLDETGTPLRDTSVRITSLTDRSQYGAITDANGVFSVARIPVGNVLIEAVNTAAKARTFVSENIPFPGATVTRDLVLQKVDRPEVTVKYGHVSGHVLRRDTLAPVRNVPVIVYYTSQSQTGVLCPGSPAPPECAVALVNSNDAGEFAFTPVVAGKLRIATFDQATYQQGQIETVLSPNGHIDANILLAAGLGSVHGVVKDAAGNRIAGARVGGGLSLTTTNESGEFTLTDVPVGRSTIVAVSDQLATRGSTEVDIVRAGEQVHVTVVLEAIGGVSGVVRLADQATAAPNVKVFLFKASQGSVIVVGSTMTNGAGVYSFTQIPVGDYMVSAAKPDFSDGNVVPASVKFLNQVVKADVTFRGGAGKIVGKVFASGSETPLRARVGVSGDQPLVAGGQVLVGFKHVQNFKIADTNFTTGQFSLSGVWKGPFTLRAVGQFSPDPVALEGVMPSGGATVEMNITLQPTSGIAGRVFLPDGATPAPGVVVKYKSDAFKVICSPGSTGEDTCTTIPQGVQEATAVTDGAGKFGFPLVNAGTFTLLVDDAAAGIGQIRGSVKAGEKADVSLRLLGRAAITVKVLGANGTTPIAGAEVTVQQLEFPKKKITATANGQGLLVLDGGDAFTEGAFVVTARDVESGGTGTTGRAAGQIVKDGQGVTVPVYLANQTGTVVGVVSRSDGTTIVPNAEVVVSGQAGPLAYALTDGDGAYRVEGLPLGPMSVDVFEAATARRGFANGRLDFDEQELPINVRQRALGVVRGVVLESGSLAPLKGWEVTLAQTALGGRGLPSLKTSTSVDGSYSFPGASEGTVTLFARHDGVNGSGSASGAIEREGQVLDIPVLARIVRPFVGSLTGRVLNADGSPSTVSLVDICRDGCGSQSATATVPTGSDGSFRLDQLPLGRYQARARVQGSADTGSAFAPIAFDGEVVGVTINLMGLRQIKGQVVRNGNPVANVDLRLDGDPGSGCTGPCLRATDGQGRFHFTEVPARRFTITASDPVSLLKGSIGDVLSAGETKDVTIVLEPSGSLTGRVRFQNGDAASGVVADLQMNGAHLFTQSGADGTFTFEVTKLGSYTLSLEDPAGNGIAEKTGTLSGAVNLGDIRLDETAPGIGSITPAPLSTGAALDTKVRLVFTEKIEPGSATDPGNITLSTDTADVSGTVAVSEGDTVATFTPLAALSESTRYTVRVKGVKDLFGRAIEPDYIASFTTADLTAPVFAEISPTPNTTGAPTGTTVRLKFSEAVDPARTTGTPIVLSGPDGPVAGEVRYLFGNTVVVFVPTVALAENTAYQVQTARFGDLAGRMQEQALAYTFATTDRTPPTINELLAPTTVIENSQASVTASVPQQSDIAFVDFFVNGTLIGTARTWPFTFGFQAIPAFGAPGQQIAVAAVATDTSGNRGTSPIAKTIAVVADQPPTVAITAPANGLTAGNGSVVTVKVEASDDLGVTQLGYKAHTGAAQDAATSSQSPATFTFQVPDSADPGAAIKIDASALDTKGQLVQATPVTITVLDAVPPQVLIAASSGNTLRPGQQATVVVTASDRGGVKKILFSTEGVVSVSDSRTLAPAQANALASFSFNVPSNVAPGASVVVNVSAQDATGNAGTATRTFLIADTVAPTVGLRTSTGSLDIVAGGSVTVLADVDDEIGVASVELTGSGAFTVPPTSGTPPQPGAAVPFTIQVPAAVTPGAVLNLQARAVDTSKNVSSPAFLSLMVRSIANVEFAESSAIVNAGESVDVTVRLPGGAPAAGQTVTFTTANANVAKVTSSVFFAEGETTKTIGVIGESGGTVKLSALVQGTERASMTISVQGGIVSGVVFDADEQPVPGVQVTVSAENSGDVAATTDGTGRYAVTGLVGPGVTVKALHPDTGLRGMTSATMNRANGFAKVNVALVPAGTVEGTVFHAGGQVAVGENVLVTIVAAANPSAPLSTTRTDADGKYEFPLVPLGTYFVEAEGDGGRRGRSDAVLTANDPAVTANIAYLARGVVKGTVFNAGGQPVSTAALTFTSTSIFGTVVITRDVEPDGTFRFEDVLAGTFVIRAKDEVTNRAAVASGALQTENQEVPVELHLAAYGTVRGHVYRHGSTTTTVANALVSLNSGLWQRTDINGFYEFAVVPLGEVTATVSDQPTRGVGVAAGTLATHEQELTLNVTLRGQGTIVATVVDAADDTVAGAAVTVEATDGTFTDTLSGTTGDNGQVIIDRVLAGTVIVRASKSGLSGSLPSQPLAAGQVAPVTVKLQPSASIEGTVFAPGGQTTQASGWAAIVRVSPFTGRWEWLRRVPLAEGGVFRFDGLTLSRETSPGSGQWLDTYQLGAFDANDRLRALVKTPIVLTGNGQVEMRNMELIAVNTVKGQVVNPNGSPAGNLLVEVRSLHPDFGRFETPKTDPNGNYQVEKLAIGSIAVSAGTVASGLLGEAFGTLTTVEPLTLNFALQSNATTLPKTLFDANAFDHDFQANGSMLRGRLNTFFGTDRKGGSLLEIVRDDIATPFTGGTVVRQENQNRELAVQQTSLAGLNVTRKMFVPRDGYFVRYLEILSNPTPEPITVAVRVTSHVRGTVAPTIVTTSSGDAVLDVTDPATRDRWLVVDDADQDPFDTNTPNSSSLAFTFDGANAPARVASGSFTTTCTTCSAKTGNLAYEWANVTIPRDGSVVFMHFVTQQIRRSAAIASAERLAQLPPEALVGLSVDEIGTIRNFAVPGDGVSTVAPMAPLTGTVNGLAVEADGLTLAKGAFVYFKSNNPIFARTYLVGAHTQTAAFTFTSSLSGTAGNIAIPQEAFTLTARHPLTSLFSTGSPGIFEPGASVAKANAVFSNLGLLKGSVRRPNGSVVTQGTLTLTAPTLSYTTSITDPFAFGGLPAGTTTLTARLNVPTGQTGTPLQGSITVAMSAGQVVPQDIELPATGGVSGTVRLGNDNLAVDLLVNLSNASQTFSRDTRTSGTGQYTFSDVPAGNYSLRAVDPATQVPTVVPVSIVPDTTTPRDFKLVGNGSIKVQVNYARGGGAPGATVRLQKAVSGPAFELVGTTDGLGQLTITNVPVTAFVVRAAHPDNSALTTDAAGNLTANGQQVGVTVELPAAGTIFGKVTFPSGGEAANAPVQLQLNGSDVKFMRTDAEGDYAFTGLEAGRPYSVYAINPQEILHKRTVTNRTLTSDAERLETNIVLPARATVKVTVLREDGSPYESAKVHIKDAFDFSMGPAGNTDANGVLLIANVGEGAFQVNALDAQDTVIGSASGVVTLDDDGEQVEVTVATLVGLPVNLFDVNGFKFDVQPNGRVLHGSVAYDNALRLTLAVNGTSAPFTGASVASTEEQGRELSIVQSGLEGLNVTRKVFVPANGYFARYLEVLENPGTTPVTVDLAIDSSLANAFHSAIVTTSNGDALLTLDDTWLVTDDDNAANPASTPTQAFALQQAGAPVAPTALSMAGGTVHYGWSGITIQPGQKAIVMHFAVQQHTKVGATGAALRLGQLPPEAIAGLSAEERAQIVNWIVPADGSSPVPPIPPAAERTGTVTGRVLGGDETTPVPDASVTLRSTTYPFLKAATQVQTSGSDGAFTFTNGFVDAFALEAAHPYTAIISPVRMGTFPAGQTTAEKDVAFTNSGVIAGTVLRNGQPVTGGNVSLRVNNQPVFIVLPNNGAYAVTGVPAGSYVLSALDSSGAGAQATAGVVDGQRTTLPINVGLGTIAGRIRLAGGGAAVKSTVRIIRERDNALVAQATTDGNGDYAFTGAALQTPYTVRAIHPTNPFDTRSITGVVVAADGQSAPASMQLGASATARVTVVATGGGSPIAGATISVDRRNGLGFTAAGTTNGSGMLDVANVFDAGFTVRATDEFGLLGMADGIVTTADDGGIVNVTIEASTVSGIVSVTLFAADGQTPVRTFGQRNLLVEVVDAASGEVLQSGDVPGGEYAFSVDAGLQGFIVRAHSPIDPATTVEAPGTFTSRGQEVTIPLTLPVGVIRGTVSTHDNQPVPDPNVSALMTSGPDAGETLFASRQDDAGNYGIVVYRAGDFQITAQDPESILSVTETGTIEDPTVVIPRNLKLPQAASVTGTVIGPNKQPAAFVSVVLISPASGRQTSTSANQQGQYTFGRVPLGAFTVQACVFATVQLCGTANGMLTASGGTGHITIGAAGSISGTVVQPGDIGVVSSPRVTLFSPDQSDINNNNMWQSAQNGTTGGAYAHNAVPPGRIAIAAFPQNEKTGGVARTTLAPGGSATGVDVTIGNATKFDVDLDGSQSGFRYDITCTGVVSKGGLVSGGERAFASAAQLRIYGGPRAAGINWSFPCAEFGELDVDRRQVSFDARSAQALRLQVARKVFVPEAGGFVRYLEVLTNPTAADLTVRVVSGGGLGMSTSGTRIAVDPSGNGNTVVVYRDQFVHSPAVGMVLGGSGAPVAPTVRRLVDMDGPYQYEWTVTVPAGQTRSVMHFLLQAAPDAHAVVASEAAALVTLSDSHALVGLTAAEKASIVNFIVP